MPRRARKTKVGLACRWEEQNPLLQLLISALAAALSHSRPQIADGTWYSPAGVRAWSWEGARQQERAAVSSSLPRRPPQRPPQPRFPKPEIAGIPQQGSCRGLDHRAAGAPGSHWAASQHRRSLQRSGGTCAGCTPGSAASAFLRTLGRHARAEICRVFGGAMPRTLCPRGGSVRRNGDTEVQASAEPQ